jgi:hypothetical protein
LQRLVERTDRKLNEALAAARELRTVVNAERRLRQRADQARDAAVRTSGTQPQAAPEEEIADLRAQLQQAHTELDAQVALVEAAESERDREVQRRAMLAIRFSAFDADERSSTSPGAGQFRRAPRPG